MEEKKRVGPIHQIKRTVFGDRIKGVVTNETNTREGLEITLSLNKEIYPVFKDIKVVILRKKNGKMRLVDMMSNDTSLKEKVTRIIADANGKSGGGLCTQVPCS